MAVRHLPAEDVGDGAIPRVALVHDELLEEEREEDERGAQVALACEISSLW